ncbi:uncharacterized protein [Clytia hemisphaerica]|uniref:uncharacterized protein n=1 Tax=Clytia hemisphaerica TaxID=252671 RepID=UPI0034D60905
MAARILRHRGNENEGNPKTTSSKNKSSAEEPERNEQQPAEQNTKSKQVTTKTEIETPKNLPDRVSGTDCLRKRRLTTYADLDGNYQQYQRDLKRAIEKSRAENSPQWDLTEIENEMVKRDLEVYDNLGDGNCFYHAVAHQLFGDPGRDVEVRESAIRYIANHPDEFLGFGESLEDPDSL